jgi:hypothetical protein
LSSKYIPIRASAESKAYKKQISAHDTWADLSSLGDLITPKATNRADFIKECQSGGLNGVVVCYRTFASVDITGVFDEDLVGKLPESLKFICHVGKSNNASFAANAAVSIPKVVICCVSGQLSFQKMHLSSGVCEWDAPYHFQNTHMPSTSCGIIGVV